MRLSAADIKQYPAFARYLSVDFPEVRTVKPIIEAMRELSGNVTSATIKNAFVWGKGPMIQIDKTLIADGEFDMGKKSQVIRIKWQRVKDFEDGMQGLTKKHIGRTKAGDLVPMIGVALLHELTHWADDQDGVDDPVPGDPSNEEGWAFEMKIFGRISEPFK